MQERVLEVCVDSVESARAAIEGGAGRLELCGNLIIGGTTPSLELFHAIRRESNIKIHVLIRPRFGDFCYTASEFEIIKREIEMFREAGAEGIVIGVLRPDGTLDKERMQELIALRGNMSVTLHRAFDVCVDPYVALEEAIALGMNTILTSGQANNCLSGMACIKELVQRSADRITILVAGGVQADVIRKIHEATDAKAYHMSGKIEKESAMVYRKEGVNMGLDSLSEFVIWQTDATKIKEAKKEIYGE